MDYPYVIVGGADGKVFIFNLDNLSNMNIPNADNWYELLEIGSKYTCAAINANKRIYAFGCTDGRCVIG